MDLRGLKANSAEVLKAAATILLAYGLFSVPFLLFGTARTLTDLAFLGIIAVPIVVGALVVLVGLLAVYLVCLPVRLLQRVSATRGAKPRRKKKGVWDKDFDM